MRILLAALVLMAILLVGCNAQEIKLFTGINQARTDRSIPALGVSNSLHALAHQRAVDMARCDCFYHDLPPGAHAEVIARNNYPNRETAAIAVQGWLDSPGHRAILLDRVYRKLGTGSAKASSGMWYHVGLFAR